MSQNLIDRVSFKCAVLETFMPDTETLGTHVYDQGCSNCRFLKMLTKAKIQIQAYLRTRQDNQYDPKNF